MTRNELFHHALTVDTQACMGCAHCIRRCPTKALRIRSGRASLRKDWCVDCGECLKVCPVRAIYVEQDDFDTIFDYSCRVVLFPAAFLGQFPETFTEAEIMGALRALGFTHAFPVEMSVGIIRERMAAEIADNRDKPLISPLCPAVVRLIQTKFPDLTERIMTLRTPAETTAILCRRRLLAQGHEAARTGIFYVTPCAAKVATGKTDRDGRRLVDGIINLDSLYNRVCRILGSRRSELGAACADEILPRIPRRDMGWSLCGGEASAFEGRCLAVDGIDNVKDFLERTEATGDLHEVDFLELRACNRGCMGGSLTPVNRFLAEQRLHRRLLAHPDGTNETPTFEEREVMCDNMHVGKVRPMTKLLYKGNIEEVLRSMDAARKIRQSLPGLDCGACGSPTCESLSHDIVRGEAHPSDCIFAHLASDCAGGSDAMNQLERVWGCERFRHSPQENTVSMKLNELIGKLDLTVLSGEVSPTCEVSGGYTSDLLSDVMGNAEAGTVWITLQIHRNVIAVAALKELAAVLLVGGAVPDAPTLEAAREEGVVLLSTPLSAFTVSGRIYDLLK